LRKELRIDRNSLVVQLVFSFMALILLTTLAVGLPAILLIRNQVERQTWARVNQGSHATEALYSAWQRRISDLALLTSQRPTLSLLLSQEQGTALANYLQTLQEETELDLILVCDADHHPIIQTSAATSTALCRLQDPTGLHVIEVGNSPQVWMMAAHPIDDESTDLGQVVVGILLDDEFSRRMSAQTSLEHTILVNEQPVASSLTGGAAACCTSTRQPIDNPAADIATMPAFLEVNNRPYYSTRLVLSPPGLIDEIALDVDDVVATERNLTWILVGSIILVALAGSVLGVAVARRIGQPLTRLTEAATAISMGDQTTSLSVPSQVREVTLVSQALERARVDLQRTLNELQRERAWIDHLLEAITEGIVALDDRGCITFFSPGAERITGWSQSEALNHTCDEIFHLAETSDTFSQHIPLPGQQSKILLEMEDGRQITLGITSAQLSSPDSGETGLVLVLRDISEAELIHRLLGGFLANITHEFRTPLSSIAASTELLLDQAPDLSQAELQKLLTSLYMGIISLQTLIDNLLESASLEAGRFQVYVRPSDLGEIIAEAVHMTQPLQEKYGQSLVVELPATIPLVLVDSRRIVQVLVNLLFNAIKYSPDETKIKLNAIVNQGRVRIAVADQGPGVPPGRQDELFYQFVHYDADDAKSRHGVGLGLSVVKAIIEAASQ
jgi:two-component system phosphate regulon sensor histidine kinase PhoR